MRARAAFLFERAIRNYYIPLLAIAVSCYVLVRACTVSITHDEVWTILHFAQQSFHDIVTYQDPIPNNHLLHTLGVKLFTHFFGRHQLPARMPNLIGFFCYLYATIQFSRYISKHPAVQAFTASALLLNVFLLDFFSIARGYGLSIDLMLLACWLAFRWMTHRKQHTLPLALYTAVLAVYANFTVLNFFVPFIFLLFLMGLLLPGTGRQQAFRVLHIVVAVAVLAAISYIPITKMRATNQFAYWGTNGFYKETLSTVSDMSLGNGRIDLNIINGIIIGLIVVMLLAFVLNTLGKKRDLLRPPNFFLFLLLGAMAVPILQFYLVGTPYLSTRTAVWYYPLFVLAVAFYAALLTDRYRMAGAGIALAGTTFALLTFAWNANLRTVKEWWFDKNTPEVISYLKQQYEADPLKRPITLDCTWYVNPGLSFYIETDNLQWLKLITYHKEVDPASTARYYYTMGDERETVKANYQPVVNFFETDRTLFLRKDDTIAKDRTVRELR